VTLVGGIVAALGPAIWGTGVMLTNLATIGKTKLGTAVIDGFNSLRTAIANAVTQAGSLRAVLASRAFLTVGGIGLAIAAFAVLVSKIHEAQDAANKLAFGDVAGEAERALIAITALGTEGQFKGTLKDVGKLKDAIVALREAPPGPGPTDFLGLDTSEFKVATDSIAEYDNALKELFRVDPAAAAKAFELLSAELRNQGVSVDEVNAAFDDYLGSLADSNEMSPETKATLEGLGITFGDVEDEISAAEQALKDWADTVKAQFEPAFAYQDAVYDQADAVLALEEAQKKQKEVLASFPADSAEARDALRQLNEAERNLIITTGELNARQNGLLEGLKNGEISAKDAIDTIRGLGDQHGLTAEQIQGQIDNFNALAALVLMTEFPSVVIPVNSNAAEVLEKLLAIKAAVDALKAGASATVNVIGNVVRGFATGGPVTAGMPHMVGERGRELFIPSTDGVIVPHHQSRALMGAGAASDGGTNVTYNVTINGMVGRDKQDILAYLARELPKVAATQARSFG
jgi:phage-related minor tail protein